MAMPELGVARILGWCSTLAPEFPRETARVEAQVTSRHVTIVQRRPSWQGLDEWFTHPVARLRSTGATGLWGLYWRDHDGKFHICDRHEPTAQVRELLEVLGDYRRSIFQGRTGPTSPDW